MEQGGEQIRTDIADEQPLSPEKGKKRIRLFLGLGAALLAIAVAMYVIEVRQLRLDPLPGPTAEDLVQQKYDADQAEQARQKAAGIRNDPFLVRKGDNSQSQLDSLLKDLNIEKEPTADLPAPARDQQAKAEEEAIAHVLRDPTPAPSPPARPVQSRPAAAQSPPAESSSDADMHPMFVYSRTFGAAKYVEALPKQAAQRLGASTADQAVDQPASTAKVTTPVATASEKPGTQPVDQTTTIIYTDLPPVTLYEGEMLEAVLVNRIIADTEPAPVVCHLARDFFDHSTQYVVLPANSRIVGLSQVVNYKGAHRLFISFNRIILPNGPSIDLPSSRKALKALDETGALGVVSNVERHWFLQFGTAVFFGALDGLAGAAQRNRDVLSTSSVVLGRTSENFQHILENIMTQYSTIVPTIRVDQGKMMRIYLSDDLLISPYAKISDRSYYGKR